MPKDNWLKIATRNLPFYRMVMIYQSFARSKKVIGWPYGDSLTTFDNGIINLYRRKSDLEKYLAHFLKIKNKKEWLKKIEQRVKSFKIGREKDFSALYGQFLEFWPLANLPLALENALRILGRKKTLAKHQRRLLKIRGFSQYKILRLENLLDRSVKKPSWQYGTPAEILKSKISPAKLKNRRKSILILEKGRVKIVTGGRAATWFKIFTEAIEGPAVIRGRTAYPGRARGRAKIVFYKKDLAKLKKGDILVAPMTEPDFVLAMKKAAAIITDEGGITSHAAIIARELKKPCIIGTKVATKVLKDGDLVEVDAGRGEVKIVK